MAMVISLNTDSSCDKSHSGMISVFTGMFSVFSLENSTCSGNDTYLLRTTVTFLVLLTDTMNM